MKLLVSATISFLLILACSCSVMVNEPPTSTNNHPSTSHDPVRHAIGTYFPFEDNSNQWYYTESGGNNVSILVTDTISDNGVAYTRVSFRENRVDTTDDWFKRDTRAIYFAPSLMGPYRMFLPSVIDSTRGSFFCGESLVHYSYYDSLIVNGSEFHRVVRFVYDAPPLHGFDEITFADSIGIIQLIDNSSRWTVIYNIDSCSISGSITRF